MFCAISGEVPQEPVVSKLSGHVFERRLIEKYLAEKGMCPVTGQNMRVDDLLLLKVANPVVPVKTPSATSIPSLLATFQNEWDAVMLECHTLKQHLDATRKELSHSLFQYDAACRLIAKLLKEKEEAKSFITSNPNGLDTTSSN